MSARLRAALLAAALVLPACGVEAQRSPEPVPPERLPTASASASGSVPAQRIRVWGARDRRLVPVFVEVTDSTARGRVAALLELGDPGQRPPTALPEGTRLLRLVREGDGVDLSLSAELRSVPVADLPLALAQLVFTVTEQPGTRRVQVSAGEDRVPYVDATGRTIDRPLVRTDFDGLLQVSDDD